MSRQSRLNKSMDTLFPQPSADKCRVCHEDVVDGRWNYCSERCRDIANAVQSMFIWDTIRRQVLERDDYTCQVCGLSKDMAALAYYHVQGRVNELADSPEEWDRLWDAYGVGWWSGHFHVDHIQPISKGGHPFEESNLRTLCKPCHEAKTARENRGGIAEQRPELGLDAYL